MDGVYSWKDVFIYATLDEMWVIGLMRRQDGCHLVVVGGMDVLINAVPGQLYLLRITQVINSEGRRGFSYPVFVLDHLYSVRNIRAI